MDRRAVVIAGRKTGVSLEDDFWEALGEIVTNKGTTRPALIANIDRERGRANLSSAVRQFVLAHYRKRRHPPSPIEKRSLTIAGRQTSVGMEDAFWSALREIAATKRMSVTDLVATIDKDHHHVNLSSVIRVFVLQH